MWRCVYIKTKRNVFGIVLLSCAIAVLVISLAYVAAVYIAPRIKNDNLVKEVKEPLSESTQSAIEEGKGGTDVEVPVKFDELKEVNKDIYAWIEIPGTKVNYAVVRSDKNNGFYLNRDLDKKWSASGSIYTEDYNSKDFTDFNTLLYGHNMKNKTMFGGLKDFRKASFFEENRYIYIYMENCILKYEIFAACTWDNKHILANRNFDLEENRTAYLDEIFAVRDMDSQINKNISVTADDKIITLSTCMNNDQKRLIVSGVLIYDSRNP